MRREMGRRRDEEREMYTSLHPVFRHQGSCSLFQMLHHIHQPHARFHPVLDVLARLSAEGKGRVRMKRRMEKSKKEEEQVLVDGQESCWYLWASAACRTSL